MAQELVWARVGDSHAVVSRAYAEKKGLEVFDDEPVTDHNGDGRRPVRVTDETTEATDAPAGEKRDGEKSNGAAKPLDGPNTPNTPNTPHASTQTSGQTPAGSTGDTAASTNDRTIDKGTSR